MKQDQLIQPAILTIFGISGDLAHRKLLPALYQLIKDGVLPEQFAVVGVSRRDITPDSVLDQLKAGLTAGGDTLDQAVLEKLRNILTITTMDISVPAEYDRLKQELDEREDKAGVCMNRLFYLAIPSHVFGPVVNMLGASRLHTGCQHAVAESRLLIEKPFGFDMVSAEELVEVLSKDFVEQQLYRIDHYLAKETVQNILTFRFQNPLFEGSWSGDRVSHVMITAAERIGIEGRVVFYEQTGALRDLIQSHLLQLLALVLMKKPQSMTSDGIHAAKLAALQTIMPPRDDHMDTQTVRGQYDGYTDEVQQPASQVETFAAVQLHVDDPAWQDVPIFLRTGKKLTQKATEINIVFQRDDFGGQNQLTIRIQPNEGIILQITVKKPGYENSTELAQMNFCYGDELSTDHAEAYRRVLIDALRGDRTLFATSSEVLECWRIIQPVLHAWEQDRSPLADYKAGSWGPSSADDLVKEAVGGTWLASTLHACTDHSHTH